MSRHGQAGASIGGKSQVLFYFGKKSVHDYVTKEEATANTTLFESELYRGDESDGRDE